ncbi:hypothetical protein DSM43518_02877 [Mycobacterium marinum]|nr:hypothetical protein DSM43518_02877 [Mycobacterium marinum]
MRRAEQPGDGLGLRQYGDIEDAGIVERPAQVLSPVLIRPAQPSGDQVVSLVGQQLVRADYGFGQHRDRAFGQIYRGLVDHGTAFGGRPDERQACDRTCDRNPQHDVHLRFSFGWPPRNQQCPASLHCDTVGCIRHSSDKVAPERSVTGFPNGSGTLTTEPVRGSLDLSHCRVVRMENMFAIEQRSGSVRGFPHRRTKPEQYVTYLDPWGTP